MAKQSKKAKARLEARQKDARQSFGVRMGKGHPFRLPGSLKKKR